MLPPGADAAPIRRRCPLFLHQAENKFKCPCHGSQYNDEGKVIRGPAPLVRPLEAGRHHAPATVRALTPRQSLALAHVTIAADDTVVFSPWTETDFRRVC